MTDSETFDDGLTRVAENVECFKLGWDSCKERILKIIEEVFNRRKQATDRIIWQMGFKAELVREINSEDETAK